MRALLAASLLMFGSMTEAKHLDPEQSEIILSKGTILHIEQDSHAYEALVSYKAQIYKCYVVDRSDPRYLWIFCNDSEKETE